MATYTVVSKVISSTAASGMTGYNAIKDTQNTAVATAITTAMAVTGFVPQSLGVTQAITFQDANASTLYMQQTITYTLQS